MSEKTFTGRKFLMLAIAFFGVIIAVNVFMAYNAIATFPGLEVKNSYVASQVFDRERKAQEALGWHVETAYDSGVLTVAFRDKDGLPVRVEEMGALVARPTQQRDDQTPDFAYANGTFSAPLTLAPGQWNVMVNAKAHDGTAFRQKIILYVKAES